MKKRSVLISFLVIGVLVAGSLVFFAATAVNGSSVAPDKAKSTSAPQPAEPSTEPAADSLLANWGVEILGLHTSAGGYMLDFRYRVIDPEKAAPLFDPKVAPILTHEASGSRFGVPAPPKVGPLRTMKQVQKDHNYFVLFANPGGFVKEGDLVSVTIGDFSLEHLRVE